MYTKEQEILELLQKRSDERYQGQYKDKMFRPPAPVATIDSHLELDLGFDSLDRIEMWMDLEEKYKIDIPEEEVKDIVKVSELVAVVQKYIP